VLESIAAVGSALNAAYKAGKAALEAHDAAIVREKVGEMQGQISSALASAITAQTDQMTALDLIRDLKKQLAEFEEWGRKKHKYLLKEVGPGATARLFQPDADDAEPPHWVCPTCYEHRKTIPLQGLTYSDQRGTGDVRSCPECKTKVAFPRGFVWPPA